MGAASTLAASNSSTELMSSDRGRSVYASVASGEERIHPQPPSATGFFWVPSASRRPMPGDGHWILNGIVQVATNY